MLTDVAVRNALPRAKPYKLSDSGGLYLLVKKSSKYWRMNYRYAGKQQTLSIGVYPTVTLTDAREKRDAAKKHLSEDIDPKIVKAMNKLAKQQSAANTFHAVGIEWMAKQSNSLAQSSVEKITALLEKNIYPWVGKRPIKEITPPELLAVLQRIENRGAIETAHRCRMHAGQIFRYAIATGRTERDISMDLRGALTPVKVTHHPAITDEKEIGALMREINIFKGSFVTKCALQFLALVFVRSNELRRAEWIEINFDKNEWRIPAVRMTKVKPPQPHIVPLSRQAMAILKLLYPLTGSGQYVFYGRCATRPMSENTINAALRRMGYAKDEMCGHGFRGTASTTLYEHKLKANLYEADTIEVQLSHLTGNSVSRAYNYAELLPARKVMMQWWADYLDELTRV